MLLTDDLKQRETVRQKDSAIHGIRLALRRRSGQTEF